MRMGELIANSYVYFRPYNPFTAVALSLLGQAYKVVKYHEWQAIDFNWLKKETLNRKR